MKIFPAFSEIILRHQFIFKPRTICVTLFELHQRKYEREEGKNDRWQQGQISANQ